MKINIYWIVLFTCFFGCKEQETSTLYVMCSGGLTAAYQGLAPLFSEHEGIDIKTSYGASMGGAKTSIPVRLDNGEYADVVILAEQGFENLSNRKDVIPGTRTDLAHSSIGMVVQEGKPKPDIQTKENFISVLLNAQRIAYSASASGTYLSQELFPSLGIEEELKKKSVRVVGERVGSIVARGEAEIGFQQISELLPIDGVDFVGPIPDDIQKITVFVAAITTASKHPKEARALIDYLSSGSSADVIERTGMTSAFQLAHQE